MAFARAAWASKNAIRAAIVRRRWLDAVFADDEELPEPLVPAAITIAMPLSSDVDADAV